MKLDYNLINTITNCNKKEEAATILDGYFSDLEGRPIATPTKVRSFVAYSYAKESTLGITYAEDSPFEVNVTIDMIERVFSEYNKSYNINDYPFGFVFYEGSFGYQLIVPINKIELDSEAHSYTVHFDFGDGYIGKITVFVLTDTDTETGDTTRASVNDRILFTPEHTEYQEPEMFDLESEGDYVSEEYINHVKLHIKESLILHQIFPNIVEAIESDKHCWFIPYYANNNIETEELTSLEYSKNSPFLPLVFNAGNEYLIIQPELPNYIHTNEA